MKVHTPLLCCWLDSSAGEGCIPAPPFLRLYLYYSIHFASLFSCYLTECFIWLRWHQRLWPSTESLGKVLVEWNYVETNSVKKTNNLLNKRNSDTAVDREAFLKYNSGSEESLCSALQHRYGTIWETEGPNSTARTGEPKWREKRREVTQPAQTNHPQPWAAAPFLASVLYSSLLLNINWIYKRKNPPPNSSVHFLLWMKTQDLISLLFLPS